GSISDIPPFRIGNGELFRVVAIKVVHGPFKRPPSLGSMGLVECKIGLIGHTMGLGGLNDGPVELENGVRPLQYMSGNLGKVGIQSDTEKGLLFTDLQDELF